MNQLAPMNKQANIIIQSCMLIKRLSRCLESSWMVDKDILLELDIEQYCNIEESFNFKTQPRAIHLPSAAK